MEIRDILKKLPHRYPFLLIDRVKEVIPGERIIAIKNMTINEPFLQGHFPGNPVMPGVLIVEAMAQAGGVLAFTSMEEDLQGAPVYFMGINKVKFRKPVLPGDQLVIDVSYLKKSKWAVKFAGIVTVEESKAAEAELTATLGNNIKVQKQ